jgi:hypothetical protein
MRLAAPIAALILASAWPGARIALAALDMSDGLWETSVTSNGETRSLGTSCYTKADIAEMERMLQGKSARNGGACRYADFTQSGSSIRYTMICRNGESEQTSTVVAEYHGDSAVGSISAGNASVTTRSWRVGSCSQSSFAP